MSSKKKVRDLREYTVLAAVTTEESGNSSAYNVQNYHKLTAYMVTTNAGGTSPTLDVKIQTYIAGTWVDTGIAFGQFDTDEAEYLTSIDGSGYFPIPLGKQIRFVWTITGTTPTFDITLTFTVQS